MGSMKNELTIEEVRMKKGRLYDDIYLLVNRFVQDTGLYPTISASVTREELKCAITEKIGVTVEVIL
jgi:hypothetical protein